MKLEDATLENVPFGGKVFVFGGDFRQIIPIVRHGNRPKIVSSCLNSSKLWKQVQLFKLTINKRLIANPATTSNEKEEFATYLLRIDGREPVLKDLGDDMIELPDDICMPLTTLSDLISEVYDDFLLNYTNTDYLIQRALLATTNKIVIEANKEILNLLPTPLVTYFRADTPGEDADSSLFPTEFLNTIDCNGLPPHELNLKLDSVIICLRNLNSYKGLCNGTRLIVRGLQDHVIDCEIISGSHIGDRVFLPRIHLQRRR